MNSIINEVKTERQKQDAKWGEQNHKPIERVGLKCIENYRAELIQLATVTTAATECLTEINNHLNTI